MRRFLFVASLAIPFGTASSAHADDEAVATELFILGRDLMKAGDYTAACPKLAGSVRLKPTVGALAKLASCEEHEGRLANARARWEQAEGLAHAMGDTREASVVQERVRLDAIVPKLSLFSRAPLPEGAIVKLDNHELGLAILGAPLPVDPGQHEIQVFAPHKRAWSAVVMAAADGATTSVEIPPAEDLTQDVAPTVGPSSTAPAAPFVATKPALISPLRVVALSGAAVGAGSLVTGAVLAVNAISRKDAAGCSGTACPNEGARSKLEAAQASANGATVAFVVGGALLASGITLWLLSPRVGSPRPVTLGIHPSVGGAVLRGEW